MFTVELNTNRTSSYVPPHWNFKKANWCNFASCSDVLTTGLNVNTRQSDKANKALTEAILTTTQECIPRGSRRNYISYWSGDCRPCMRKSLKQGTWWKQTQVLTTIYVSRPKPPSSEERATWQSETAGTRRPLS